MLEIKDLHVSYGGIQALRGVSLTVPEGKIVTLIGANGAGKSTLMRTISGLVKAQSGSILWNGQELLGKPIDQIVASGIAMSPEGRRVFADLTVVENLKIGAYLRKDRSETEKDLEWVYSLFPRLKERSWQSAGTLSGGEQQMLAVGRALMSKPRLLMLDEPSLGLAPIVVREIFDIIRTVNQQGITVLLNEQNANMALKVADYAYVLETGNLTLSGGEQQMLAVGRALMSKPKLLMLDEPSLGLAPIVVREIFDIIRTVNQQGITVLLNEQNANMALKVADYAYVLETGNLTLSGTGAELLANEQVKAAYLGRKRTV